jgi:hypothetical protein
LAGLAAGTAEWFRTGTVLLFAVPCVIHVIVYFWQRSWTRLRMPGAAFAGLLLMAGLAGRAVPSAVNKTVANLWHNLAENEGPVLTEEVAGVGPVNFSMGGYRIVEGTMETYNDWIVRQSRNTSNGEFLAEHGDVVFPLYFERLQAAAVSGFANLRWMIGDIALALFAFQMVLSLIRRDETVLPILAFGAGGLAYYFGPVVLLRGEAPSHYLLLALPLFLLVAVRGGISLFVAASRSLACSREKIASEPVAATTAERRRLVLKLVLGALACFAIHNYLAFLNTLREYQEKTEVEQAAVDALPLEDRMVACRNMSWFVDRNVRTILLPYASVPELEKYVQAHHIDGILVWDNETQLYFRATPYGSLKEFDRAIRKSPIFATPMVSGAWRWYAVRRTPPSRGQP